MPNRVIEFARIGFSALALILAIVLAFEGVQNRSLQDKVNSERAELTRAQAFANIDNSVVQLLAKTAVEKNDNAIRGLLASNGVTLQLQPNAAGAPATAGSQ